VLVCIAAIVVAGSWIAWHKVRPVPAPAENEFFVEQPAATTPPPPIMVHVSGEVARPGLYQLRSGARVVDAVNAAGGPTPAADLGQVNLAALVQDGDKVQVPAQVFAPAPAPANQPPAPGPTEKISINRGTLEELDRLPGVGPKIAERIIQYRQTHGYFRSLEQLKEVPGIGDRNFERMRPMLTL